MGIAYMMLSLFLLFALVRSVQSEPSFIKTNRKAANVALYTLAGTERKILKSQCKALAPGGYLLLNFTSYTCRPCGKEIPELEGLVKGSRHKLWVIYTDSDRVKISDSVKKIGIGTWFLLTPWVQHR